MPSLYIDGQEHPLRETSQATVKITRSFSYKLNVGNYESRDFFCSQSGECAAADAEAVSADLQQFCIDQVLGAVKEYRAALNVQRERKVP
jgi:hypothetical protein